MANPTKTPRPPYRKLRVFAFDPSLQNTLDTANINSVEVEIPWEDNPDSVKSLRPLIRVDGEYGPAPGPVGEYLEVVDYDPASNCFYDPVDINDPYLLAQHGLAPSDGNPQFHQQMVYAVAMKTIKVFEKALGRQVLWDFRPNTNNDPDHNEFVQRLRIYPHAFREANAYYSPDKKALLFGYFPATSDPSGNHLPGGIVFTCLSHDIIVHEMSHAILDGMHRRFIEDSNPDVLAFHEAFSDIVALFQHFTFPEIVKHQLAKNRGDLKSENLLGELAKEFGRAIGRSGALRSAIGQPIDLTLLERTMEPHDRGAVLVAAVFDAFVAIYNYRTRDLIRIASDGTGVLKQGALHPDLINRLAKEASKSAAHILTICIRALDYLPPVDVTFGDYLRAMVTADKDLVPNDPLNYRIAIIEAFRRRGIYPRDVRTLSEESLIWGGPAKDLDGNDGYFTFVDELKGLVKEWDLTINRNDLYDQMKTAKENTHDVFNRTWDYKGKYLKGLTIESRNDIFEVHSVRPVRRIGPDGQLLVDLLVEITQERPGFFDKDYGGLTESDRLDEESDRLDEPDFWFRGGCTILIDMKTTKIRYCIYKDINSKSRYKRQQKYLKKRWQAGSFRATYFKGYDKSSEGDLFALLHGTSKTEDTYE